MNLPTMRELNVMMMIVSVQIVHVEWQYTNWKKI